MRVNRFVNGKKVTKEFLKNYYLKADLVNRTVKAVNERVYGGESLKDAN